MVPLGNLWCLQFPSRKRVAIEAQTPKPRKICMLLDVRKHDYRIHMLYRIFYAWTSLCCTLVARSQLFADRCIQVLMSRTCEKSVETIAMGLEPTISRSGGERLIH
ncbi:hypothetical protein OIU74_005138 [Salix koriyanagi]|uniref:Uncharacterized protein n=1 Tax=Salix koriyanagi TaxID=2511006 RepID=A0A9Q0ZGA8_9ROSI|nr:hypothetical protein OIU74_005138 [Salix koriyanagi]